MHTAFFYSIRAASEHGLSAAKQILHYKPAAPKTDKKANLTKLLGSQCSPSNSVKIVIYSIDTHIFLCGHPNAQLQIQ